MFRRFVRLEWKSFFRAPSFNFHIILKIFLGLGIVFYFAMFLMLGVAAYYGLDESGYEPLRTVNKYLIFWWAFDLVVRYFLQRSPLLKVRPFLSMPIRKSVLTNYILGKSGLSVFNFYPLFFFIPFSITLLINGYHILGVIAWFLAMLSIICINNFLFLLINNKNAVFISFAAFFLTMGALAYYQLLDITIYTGPVFQSFYEQVWVILILFAVVVWLYRSNYRFYFQSLYLDEAFQKKNDAENIKEYTWLNRFGLMGTFLKNDLRLIFRNKRSRNTVWAAVFFLFYGLLIFSQDMYRNSDSWMIFAGVFISGGFLFSFGGFVPSWDSAYYPLMMSQNIKYREYLLSKWWLMMVATITSMILSSFYILLDPKYYWAILAGGIYNIGINGYVVLFGGAYTKTPIDLSSGKKPFGDKRAFNYITILLAIPKIVFPIFIFWVFKLIYNAQAGLIAIAVTGVLGVLLRNPALYLIEKIYKEEKYDTLLAYKKDY